MANRYQRIKGADSIWDGVLQGAFVMKNGRKEWLSGAGFGTYNGVFGPGTNAQRQAKLREGEREKQKYLNRYAWCGNCGHSKIYHNHKGKIGNCKLCGCKRYK